MSGSERSAEESEDDGRRVFVGLAAAIAVLLPALAPRRLTDAVRGASAASAAPSFLRAVSTAPTRVSRF
ncbi:MAG: hypothetical protein ABR878_07170 [Roseiarcus sp.]|jgi:hypothetical protein